MKYFFIFISIVLTGCGDSPEPKPQKPQETPQPVVQKPPPPEVKKEKAPLNLSMQLTIDNTIDGAEKLPEVEFSDDNITQLGATKGIDLPPEATMPLPSTTTAATLKQDNLNVLWQPKWRFWGTGRFLLTSIELSDDKSTLAFVEQFGSEKGPFGSRVVLIDTYKWSVLAIHTFKDKKIAKIIWDTSGTSIYCFAQAQQKIKQQASLFRYTFADKSSEELIAGAISGIIALEDRIVVHKENSQKISLVGGEGAEMTSKNSVSLLKKDEDNNLIVFGDNAIEIFSREIHWPQHTFEHNYDIASATVLETAQHTAFVTKSNKLIIQNGANFRELAQAVNPNFVYIADQKLLVVKKLINSSLEFYQVPEMVKVDEEALSRLRPRTKGDVAYLNYIPHQKKYIILDTLGNLFMVAKPKHRWLKFLILESQR